MISLNGLLVKPMLLIHVIGAPGFSALIGSVALLPWFFVVRPFSVVHESLAGSGLVPDRIWRE